jgi:hypothetical protein
MWLARATSKGTLMHTNSILEIAIAAGVRLALRRQAPMSGAALEHAPCRFRPATKRFRAHHPCDRPGQHGCGWPSQRRRSWQPWSDSCERVDPSGIDPSPVSQAVVAPGDFWAPAALARGEGRRGEVEQHRKPRCRERCRWTHSRANGGTKCKQRPPKRRAPPPRYSRRAKLSLCGVRALLFAAVHSAAMSITGAWRRVLDQPYPSDRSGELLAFGEHGQSGLTVSSI